MATISLMTDFGIKDGNVGVMKGVIWRIAPATQVSDLSHMVGPQNIHEAALILFRSAPYFPVGSIHVVVVDPGVGTARRPMAARIGSQYFVGPDNGVITMWLERAEQLDEPTEFIHLTKRQYWLSEISYVFHGRDIFAPVAGHLASGVPLHDLGESFRDPVRLSLPKPTPTANGWQGEVIHIDHFGNLATSIRAEQLAKRFNQKEKFIVRVAGKQVIGLVNTFGERPVGDLVALMGSTGNLVISVVNGSAAASLGSRVGDRVELDWE